MLQKLCLTKISDFTVFVLFPYCDLATYKYNGNICFMSCIDATIAIYKADVYIKRSKKNQTAVLLKNALF